MTIPRNLSFLAEGASSTGVLGVANGGTGNVSLTAGYIPYGNGTSAFSSSSNLNFNGISLGIGTTPFANSLSNGLDLSGGAGLWGFSNQTELTCNAYYNYGFYYKANGYANLYQMQFGQHQFLVATSGTANSVISFTQAVTIFNSGGVSIGNTTDAGAGNLSVSGTIKTQGYTVATLPTGVTGARAYVTNALAPSYGATVVGGGAITIPVFYNGTNWIVA